MIYLQQKNSTFGNVVYTFKINQLLSPHRANSPFFVHPSSVKSAAEEVCGEERNRIENRKKTVDIRVSRDHHHTLELGKKSNQSNPHHNPASKQSKQNVNLFGVAQARTKSSPPNRKKIFWGCDELAHPVDFLASTAINTQNKISRANSTTHTSWVFRVG